MESDVLPENKVSELVAELEKAKAEQVRLRLRHSIILTLLGIFCILMGITRSGETLEYESFIFPGIVFVLYNVFDVIGLIRLKKHKR